MAEVLYPDLPAGGPLLLRSLVRVGGRPRRVSALPPTVARVRGHRQDVARLARYDEVCGYTLRDAVSPTWIHVLTFGLQLALMSQRDFPFGLAGLVHVSNDMTLLAPVHVADPLDLSVRASGLAPHRRGATFDLLGEARVDGQVVWQGRSTYLARGVAVPGEPEPRMRAKDPGVRVSQVWRLPADLGRRYAAVSGDVNPIHLSALAARAFGFPSMIVHGMWTHARALAALEGRLGTTYRVAVDFTKPIPLPGRVGFAAQEDGDGIRFAVRSRSGTPCLLGDVTHP